MRLLIASLTSLILSTLAQLPPSSPEQSAASQPRVAARPVPASQASPRFTAIDITIDSGNQPFAAYQFELLASGADAKIVGVEGGEHAAFREPPYYDPAALSQNRIIIAAFNTGRDLPSGKTRVARLHLQITGGEPTYKVKLDVAGDSDGKPVTAKIDFTEMKR